MPAATCVPTLELHTLIIGYNDPQLPCRMRVTEDRPNVVNVPWIVEIAYVGFVSAQDRFQQVRRNRLTTGCIRATIEKNQNLEWNAALHGLGQAKLPSCNERKVAGERPNARMSCQMRSNRQRKAAPEIRRNVDAVIRGQSEQACRARVARDDVASEGAKDTKQRQIGCDFRPPFFR